MLTVEELFVLAIGVAVVAILGLITFEVIVAGRDLICALIWLLS